MIAALIAVLALSAEAAVTPLPQAYAHNDYRQARPLHDALDRGFCSVEADVHLRDGELMVAHAGDEIKPGATLRKLYLEPLLARVRANGGRVHKGGPTFLLMVEFKSDGDESWQVLREQLKPYAEMLTVFTAAKTVHGAVTVVITGHRPGKIFRAEPRRQAALDGGFSDRNSPEPTLYPVISDNWGARFQWRSGRMEPEERERLERAVRDAHGHARLIRFWGAPDREEAWALLREAGVDLINTDRLERLKNFLLAPPPARAAPEPRAP